MAAFKFFNIGKANEEITRLETKVAELTQENSSLKENGPEVEAAAEKIRGELATSTSRLTKADSDLVTARHTISALTAEKEKLTTDLQTATAKLANPGEQIKNAASAQAANILAQTGAAPIAIAPNPNPAQEPKPELKGRARYIAATNIK